MSLCGKLRERTLAWAAVLVFCGSLLGTLKHQASEVHGFCTRHGELIHFGGSLPRDGGAPAASKVTSSSLIEGNHGCAALAFLHQGKIFSRAAAPVTLELRSGETATLSGGAVHPVIALLRQCPKLSPPCV
jgi:hypothetical protein